MEIDVHSPKKENEGLVFQGHFGYLMHTGYD